MRRWVGLGLASCVACAELLGADFDETSANHPGSGGADASDDVAETSDFDAADAADASDAADDGTDAADVEASSKPCTVLYVSPLGNDANLGCSTTAPKKTINAALDVARQESSVSVIRVCAGTFEEQLVLDTVVDLEGGYSCSDWQRPPTYGFPTFAPEGTTVGGNVTGQALLVTSQAASSLVDGLTILGPTAATEKDAVGVRIQAGAKPHLSNCSIQGGPTFSFDGDGSVGIRIETGATPEIDSNRIDGGSGRTSSLVGVGRAAVVVNSASPFLHDNDIRGGDSVPQASSGLGSAGVVVRGLSVMTEVNGNPLRANVIHGGDGIGPLGGLASAGVYVTGQSSVDIVKCAIQPGHSLAAVQVPSGSDLGTAVQLRGVQFDSTGALRVLQSRVYGGDLSNPGQPFEGFRVGVFVKGASSFLCENTIIHGGAGDQAPGGPGSPNFALLLADTQAPVLRHSSLYSGPSGYPTVGTAVKLEPGVTGFIVENNLLAADTNWNEPLYLEECASLGVFARVKNNLIFNSPRDKLHIDSLLGYGPTPGDSCWGWQPVESIADVESHLTTSCTAGGPTTACVILGGTQASENKTLRADCGGDAGCIPWPECGSDSITCLKNVFSSWTAPAASGYVALFGDGWTLSPSLPCAIAKSSLSLGVSLDLFGSPRTLAPSMGAHEQDSCVP